MSAKKYGQLPKEQPVSKTVSLVCRHRKTWLIAGGCIEWCSICGAFRDMKHFAPNKVRPVSKWTKPSIKNMEKNNAIPT